MEINDIESSPISNEIILNIENSLNGNTNTNFDKLCCICYENCKINFQCKFCKSCQLCKPCLTDLKNKGNINNCPTCRKNNWIKSTSLFFNKKKFLKVKTIKEINNIERSIDMNYSKICYNNITFLGKVILLSILFFLIGSCYLLIVDQFNEKFNYHIFMGILIIITIGILISVILLILVLIILLCFVIFFTNSIT